MLQGEEQKNGARGVMFQTFILLSLMVKIRIRRTIWPWILSSYGLQHCGQEGRIGNRNRVGEPDGYEGLVRLARCGKLGGILGTTLCEAHGEGDTDQC